MRTRDSKGRYVSGNNGVEAAPIGTVRIRTRHRDGGVQRAYIKIDEPNKWVLRARYVWEQANGPIPRSMGVHHKDRDKLNDDIDNLELVSKSEHIDLHRDEYKQRIVEGLVRLRRERKWSTKSATKRTGHPPSYTDAQLLRAIGTYFTTDRSMPDIAAEFGISLSTFKVKVAAVKEALNVGK